MTRARKAETRPPGGTGPGLQMGLQTTLGVLVAAAAGLETIAALKLPARAAYHVTKLAHLVASEVAIFDGKRDGWIRELGQPRDDGGFELLPTSEAFPAFVAHMNDLAAVPVTIPWGPITVAMLGDEKVSAHDLEALGPLLVDNEDT